MGFQGEGSRTRHPPSPVGCERAEAWATSLSPRSVHSATTRNAGLISKLTSPEWLRPKPRQPVQGHRSLHRWGRGGIRLRTAQEAWVLAVQPHVTGRHRREGRRDVEGSLVCGYGPAALRETDEGSVLCTENPVVVTLVFMVNVETQHKALV